MYGGGIRELGVGREQIELLALLFHADAPNDGGRQTHKSSAGTHQHHTSSKHQKADRSVQRLFAADAGP